MFNLKLEVQDFLQNKKKDFNICLCCGKTVTAELIGENYFNWCCGGEQKREPCENHNRPHNPELCSFSNDQTFIEGRMNQRLFIKEVLISLMNNYLYANFVESTEIFKAIEKLIPKIDIYNTMIKGVRIFTTKWKTALHP